jgi:predicted transposase YdaD
MPKTADATLKGLLEIAPADWVTLVGQPAAPATLIDADISTISGASDKVMQVKGSPDWLLHLEFKTGHDSAQLPPSLHLHNTLLDYRHGLLVRSVAVLLRPEADSPRLTGLWERGFEGVAPHATFRYQVIRVWQLPPQALLSGGIGTLPLAPISAVTAEELPRVISRMKARLAQESNQRLVGELWTATDVLMGLRFSRDLVDHLLQEVRGMEDSVTYQAIVAKGEAKGIVKGTRNIVLRQGRKRFGPPGPAIKAALHEMEDVRQLEHLSDRLLDLDVGSWEELLSLPLPRHTERRRKRES